MLPGREMARAANDAPPAKRLKAAYHEALRQLELAHAEELRRLRLAHEQEIRAWRRLYLEELRQRESLAKQLRQREACVGLTDLDVLIGLGRPLPEGADERRLLLAAEGGSLAVSRFLQQQLPHQSPALRRAYAGPFVKSLRAARLAQARETGSRPWLVQSRRGWAVQYTEADRPLMLRALADALCRLAGH